MLIISFVLSSVVLIVSYWASYHRATHRIDGPIAAPRFNFILVTVLTGQSARLNAAVEQFKRKLAARSSDTGARFVKIEENDEWVMVGIRSRSADDGQKFEDAIFNPTSFLEIKGFLLNKDVFVTTYKCVGDVCETSNQTIAGQTTPTAGQTTPTAKQTTPTAVTSITRSGVRPTEKLSPTQMVVAGHVRNRTASFAARLRVFDSFLEPKFLSMFLVVAHSILVLIYCVRASRRRAVGGDSDGAIENVPKIKKSSKNIVEKLQRILIGQETLDQWQTIKRYLAIVGEIGYQGETIEEKICQNRIEQNRKIMSMTAEQNRRLIDTLRNVNRAEVELSHSINDERVKIKELFKSEKQLTRDIVVKVELCDKRSKLYVRELARLAKAERNEFELARIDEERSSVEEERDFLKSFYDLPEVAKLTFDRQITDKKRPVVRHSPPSST